MKVQVACCLVLLAGLVAAERKAPYLPSGWKPAGPAFLLPSEQQKPADEPSKINVEVEASGSDFLREYGPPAVSQDFAKQALPDVATEQNFAPKESSEDVKVNQEVANQEVAPEASPESKTNEEVGKDSDSEATQQQEDVSANEIPEVKGEEQPAQNVEEALKSLGKEINTQQDAQEESAAKTIQQEAGVPADTPAGFLEYGPPAGHAEYGPPAEDSRPALRSALVQEEDATTVAPVTSEAVAVASETRRRRFSPRLRTARRIH